MCLPCAQLSNRRLPCLRYKITDVILFKVGQVKGHEWTKRWTEGVADEISQWASADTKIVYVTEGYTSQPVKLRVRQFVPQAGDALERTWVFNGSKRKVNIPPFAIVNLTEAKAAYQRYIDQAIGECCRQITKDKDKLIRATYGLAIAVASEDATSPKEKELLGKVLRLWTAIRLTTKSTYIVGNETLGMSHDIMDETSSLHGHIPLPPVMGAQIELVLIHQIQNALRKEILEELRVMTEGNNHATWLTTYLVTFILLHNVALLCQHDAGYARKHGIKVGPNSVSLELRLLNTVSNMHPIDVRQTSRLFHLANVFHPRMGDVAAANPSVGRLDLLERTWLGDIKRVRWTRRGAISSAEQKVLTEV